MYDNHLLDQSIEALAEDAIKSIDPMDFFPDFCKGISRMAWRVSVSMHAFPSAMYGNLFDGYDGYDAPPGRGEGDMLLGGCFGAAFGGIALLAQGSAYLAKISNGYPEVLAIPLVSNTMVGSLMKTKNQLSYENLLTNFTNHTS
jgi:hypothetical protein